MLAIREKARVRGPRDGSRSRWETRSRWTRRLLLARTTPCPSRRSGVPPSVPDTAGSDGTRPRSRGRRRSSRPPRRSRACSGSCARWSRRYFFGVARADQRVHGRVPDPEPRARARRRRGALGRVRARSSASCSRRARRRGRGASPRRSSGSSLLVLGGVTARLHPARAAAHAAVRRPGRRLRPRGHALADPLPDRRPARRCRGSSSGSSTRTTTSRSRRSRRSPGTS